MFFKLKKRFGKRYFYLRGNPEVKGDFDCIVHAASVGEQVLIAPFVRKLVEKGKRVLLTASTDTGLQKAEYNFKGKENVTISYFPFDFPHSVNIFFEGVKARAIIFVETELWPNAIIHASKNGLKLYLVNGRLSDRSIKWYRRFAFFMRKLFDHFEQIAVRSERDKDRFVSIGCNPDKIKVCGNLKLAVRPEINEKIEVKSDKTIVVFGSTRDYEEELILENIKDLIEKRIKVIIVPRHVERVNEVVTAIKKYGFTPVLSNGRNRFVLKNKDVLIVNETGKLTGFYEIADLCYVGGSLVDCGGQNFVEPLFLGKPTVTGKFLSNFEDMKELLGDFFFIVENGRELKFFIESFLEKEEYFNEVALRARDFLEKQGKSLDCVLEVVKC